MGTSMIQVTNGCFITEVILIYIYIYNQQVAGVISSHVEELAIGPQLWEKWFNH